MKRNVYLDTVDLEEAEKILRSQFIKPLYEESEVISVFNCLGRITKEPIFATISNPHYNASAMDGIALKAESTYGAHERNEVILCEGADFMYVDTGDYIDQRFNAVLMIEDVIPKGEGQIGTIKSVYPWENVRVVGEDIACGDMILTSNYRITPVDIGALISGGVLELEVYKLKTVGIIPTGTEIVNPGESLKPGVIIDSNSRVFESMVKETNGIPNRYDPVPDEIDKLRKAILKSVEENDITVINAGSSAGSEDYTVSLIRELGDVYIHGIAIKPGKPTIIGKIAGKPVIGIPGYPVSAYIAFKTFVLPLLNPNLAKKEDVKIEVTLSKRIVSALKHEEIVRMKVGKVGEKRIATPLNRGAGATMSLVNADGLLRIPKASEGYEAGAIVEVELLKPVDLIDRSLVSIGSHDILMDYLNDFMSKARDGYTVSSAHVGSLGGIMAVRKGETHIAPTHLLDEETGLYNMGFINKYLKGEKIHLLKGIKRWQGFYVNKGNPKNIKEIKDLFDKDVLFANRQRGSGTRVLLDYILKKEKYESRLINGYDTELTTHTSVALSVLSGNSDVGLGIQSVANLMGLEFIPVALEDYDFIIPHEYINDPRVQYFLEKIQNTEFINHLKSIGGYELEGFHMSTIEVGGT
ncbi:molybdopterin biosynthesis protein [Serpentinicella alkaliphila]|uniref:Molybdopterin molybdenumtransferase n=1 Tax=Serpentinicella alkaliphila TaxID=1734049 RepID=A0A4R2U2N6_9FIRM|nr:molybdopterin biosynthesis protein [Serpentinicella alkaliphila]QUH26847.1 molybdopterin biosynthesis protein [Serpentinicella alkaliphila]TCQ08075.1 molybdopterin molybdochelatase [Serpentinicella alkaliphila]